MSVIVCTCQFVVTDLLLCLLENFMLATMLLPSLLLLCFDSYRPGDDILNGGMMCVLIITQSIWCFACSN